MTHKLKLLFFTLLFFSCTHQSIEHREYQVGAYLWQQNSGEYQALCYQAYNIARLKLDRDLENKHNKKRAVIFDIDETVFDNSFGGAEEIVKNIPWNPDSFDKWVTRKKAHAIPGAKEFIDYAISKRVEILYVTNRTASQIDDTLENFRLLNIPAKKENIYPMDKDWSKESRRKEIRKKYEIVLLFGDNLHDFDKGWDAQSSTVRKLVVDKRSQEFGDKFIIFPNPLYGDWENALSKRSNRKENLIINP
jgi:5'-nucleotidase (lipoprotein e(P4) family)